MNEIVAAAQAWIGTPYVHQASCRGVGCDCLGLIRGVWRDLHGTEPCLVPPYTQDWNEPQRNERLLGEARRLLSERTAPIIDPGCVLLFRMKEASVAKHLGISTSQSPVPRFVHAYSGHGVCETTLSAPWKRRLVAIFDFPTEL